MTEVGSQTSDVGIQVRPFEAAHLAALEVQPAQRAELAVGAAGAVELEGDYARSVFWAGRLVACAGVQPIWAGRGFAWALIGRGFPAAGWLAFSRAARDMLDAAQAAGFTRLETTVALDFPAGIGWVRLLGFECEGLMRQWLGGRDHLLYARIRAAALEAAA